MTNIIMRSRIGYWSAFELPEGAVLNARSDDGSLVSVHIEETDVALLLSGHRKAHEHVRRLAATGRRLPQYVPTPPRGAGEPVPYDLH